MLTLGRRFLVLVALMFWQGGFTFYAAVVVPLGQEVLQSHIEQGFITRRVTNYLNLTGAITLVCLAWDIRASRDAIGARRCVRWGAWLGMTVALVALVWLHPALDSLLEPEAKSVLDRAHFRSLHRLYLWLSTLQWACAVVYSMLTLAAWRAADRSS
jgi:hypothetical protein